MSTSLGWRCIPCYTCSVLRTVYRVRQQQYPLPEQVWSFREGLWRSLHTTSTLLRKDPFATKPPPITAPGRTTLPDRKKFPAIEVWNGMTIGEIAKVTGKTIDDVEEAIVFKDMDVGDYLSFNEIDQVCSVLGYRCKEVVSPHSIRDILKVRPLAPKIGKTLKQRPPVVTIMGHVDHGKTTILDSLRKSEIAKSEHGGITQHIGAFIVSLDDTGSKRQEKVKLSTRMKDIKNLVTFLDTPGHAAFHSMRERGANVTDIVVLVVAADDGIMDQTDESIKFALSAKVPIVVAVNKIDKVNMNDPNILERIKKGLMVHGIILEEDGGETQLVRVSGLTGDGLHDLKENILALAETSNLKSPVDGDVVASVIESSVDPRRGRLASLLVRSGTLKRGDILVSTTINTTPSWAKVRSMFDEFGNVLDSVTPGFPVQVIGWKDEQIPDAGETIISVPSEREAKEFVQSIRLALQEKKAIQDAVEGRKRYESLNEEYKQHLEAKRQAIENRTKYSRHRLARDDERLKVNRNDPDADKKVNVIIKADVNGSLEVLLDVIGSYPNSKEIVKVNIVHYGVGSITETDLEMASLFPGTIIYGFNVKTPPTIFVAAKKSGIPIRPFNVIYHLIDDLKTTINEKQPERDSEIFIGEAVVIQEFMINEKNKKVPVAGSRCTRGVLKKGKDYLYRLERNNQVVFEQLAISSMRHLKDEVDTITKDLECGLKFTIKKISSKEAEKNKKEGEEILSQDPPELRFQPGDKLICFQLEKVKQKTKWTPKGF